MSSELTQEQARNIARILHAVHQRRAARLAAEQARQDSNADVRAPERGTDA